MAARELGLEDLAEDLIDEYVAAERQRSGSMVPAAAQYLPLVKLFFAAQGVVVLRGPVSRDRGGIPRVLSGPLAESIPDLVGWLKTEGYAPGTVQSVACTAGRLSAWMATQRLGVDELDVVVLSRFVAAQTRGRVRHPSSARRIVTVGKWLRASGLLADVDAEPEVPMLTPAQECLGRWADYLAGERGLRASTVREYQHWVQAFANQLADPDGSICWDRVQAQLMNQYVAERGVGYSLASRRHLVTALRSLLKWAWLVGFLDRNMVALVLRPAARRTEPVRALTPAQVAALVATADTTTPIGLRDRAAVVMIARLGLRAGEVAGLRLEDIDWHHGRVVVCGKNQRRLVLPVPVDVGQALVDYLRDGRPGGRSQRSVFLRTRPPLVGLTSKGISGIVARLAARAGLGTVHAHRLRHTAATAVLAAGGSLIEARELLGHTRTDTTKTYAKTDLAALSTLIVPWGHVPGQAAAPTLRAQS